MDGCHCLYGFYLYNDFIVHDNIRSKAYFHPDIFVYYGDASLTNYGATTLTDLVRHRSLVNRLK